MMKRTLSFILTLCLLLALAPTSILPVKAGSYGALTEEEFAKKVSQAMAQYPHGKFWNEYNGVDAKGIALAGDKICSGYNKTTGKKCTTEKYCGIYSKEGCSCKCGRFHGWQCHGFANLMADKIMGSYAISTAYNRTGANSSAGWICTASVEEYYAGDFVRINNYGHSLFIYKVEGNTVTYVDCNDTGKPCQIAWGKTISVSELKNKTSYVVHLKGNTLKGTGKTVDSTISYTNITVGNYYIKNKATGKYLTIEDGADKEKQTIYMDKLLSGATNSQVYKIYKANDGYEMMPLCSTTRVVNPFCWTVEPGKVINLYSKTNESSQWWKFQKVGDAYAIRNVQNPALCLTNSSAEKLTVETYTGAGSQLWILDSYNPQYKISYNANGGTGAPADQVKEQGSNVTLSSTKPTREAYTFLGWATSSKATTPEYQPGDTFALSENTTLYAVWKRGCEGGRHEYENGICSVCGYDRYKIMTFELNETEDGYVVTGCDESASGEIEIPATYNGLPVTGIDSHAFEACVGITSIIIPSTVTFIEWCAFGSCTGLTSITLPDSVRYIGKAAFCHCTNLTSIVFGNGIKYIDEGAFSGCTGLTSITLPDSLTTLCINAFVDCTGLTQVSLGKGCVSLYPAAFYGCSSLTSITIPASLVQVGDQAFALCDNLSSVIYCGTSEQWAAIDKEGSNEALDEATVQFHDYKNGVCGVCGQSETETDEAVIGDANGDGKVNLKDAIMVLQAANGKNVEIDRSAADVTDDGKVNLQDAIRILKRANGNPDPFPAER